VAAREHPLGHARADLTRAEDHVKWAVHDISLPIAPVQGNADICKP
jgi:hypothetical protein